LGFIWLECLEILYPVLVAFIYAMFVHSPSSTAAAQGKRERAFGKNYLAAIKIVHAIGEIASPN